MSSRCLSAVFLLFSVLPAYARVLRVCADPNNFPLSARTAPGVENRMAELIARGLNARLEFVWWLERKNLVRNTLGAGKCDALMSVPEGMPGVATTRPYYRSSYAIVQRDLKIRSLSDPALRSLRIGVHITGENLAPPASWLAREGIVTNVKGYSLFGEYGKPNPPSQILEAVAKREIDVAIVWGPLAGSFARDHHLGLQPVRSPAPNAPPPLEYNIAIGVRQSDMQLAHEINTILDREKPAVDRILAAYAIPVVRQ